MNYEEKYNKALERAREFQKSKDGLCVLTAESIFPELAESEDEKVRKEIIKFIEDFSNPCDEECDKWIAWLEKQKEQKPVEWSEEDENKLNHILEIVHIASGSEASVDEKEELESFLKSLRPSWKPSEVQLNYLLMLADYFESEGGTSNAKTLREFHEQLKKLM